MPNRGSNHQIIKQQNRGLVLKLISTGLCHTRSSLAKKTRMSKMTITNIVSELVESGYLVESYPPLIPGKRRHVIEIDIAKTAPKIMGVYVSRSKCAVVLMDLKMRCLKQRIAELGVETAETITQRIIAMLQEILPKDERILGIGVSMIGQYDTKTESVLCPVDFFNIQDYEIKRILIDAFHLPVFADNDMNCAAIMEKLYGLGKNLSEFVYVGWTDGVGAGIISNNTLYGAGNGLVGEIGHMTLHEDGPRCSCGNYGCLELYTNVNLLMRQVHSQIDANMDFLTAMKNHDHPVIDEVLNEMCRSFITILTSVVNLLDPQMIVFGHKGVYIPPQYLQVMEDEINNRFISRAYKRIPIKTSYFHDMTPVYGSACCIANLCFEGKISFDIKTNGM